MPATAARDGDATGTEPGRYCDLKLDEVLILLSEEGRAEEFNSRYGWGLDVTSPSLARFTTHSYGRRPRLRNRAHVGRDGGTLEAWARRTGVYSWYRRRS